MASIFEELMGVNSALTESVRPARRARNKVNEHKKISAKNIKVESRRIFEETDYDELDQEFSATEVNEENPDEIVLVVDPELPADEEVPEDAAENMVGDLVYKCPICGSNYVCDCDAELGEGIEVDENGVPTECPICGDDAEQILIGEIAPAEGAGEEVDPELVDNEDSVEEEVPEEEEEEFVDEEIPEDDVIEEESFDPTEDTEEEVVEESLEEDLVDDEIEETDDVLDLDIPVEEVSAEEPEEEAPVVEVNNSTVTLLLDDSKFESLMTKMIRENYKGNPMFKITRCSTSKGQLKLEYFVREGRKVTKGVLVGEGFDKSARTMKVEFKDKGAFTESFAKTPSFVVECVRVRNAVTPVSINYDYKVRVNESLYRVSGKVGK